MKTEDMGMHPEDSLAAMEQAVRDRASERDNAPKVWDMEPIQEKTREFLAVEDDPVNHPSHYTSYKDIEVIQLTEQMNFNRGNAVKYISRAGLKSKETEIQDLEKAQWYLQREIDRLKNEDQS